MSNIDRAIEPFVGGGAVLFHLLERFKFDEVHIFDLNPELILCYERFETTWNPLFQILIN